MNRPVDISPPKKRRTLSTTQFSLGSVFVLMLFCGAYMGLFRWAHEVEQRRMTAPVPGPSEIEQAFKETMDARGRAKPKASFEESSAPKTNSDSTATNNP